MAYKRVDIKRSSIFSEYTSEEQDYWFGTIAHKTLHHIDTLYYSVKIREDRVFEGQMESPEILRFITALDQAKQLKNADIDKSVTLHGFDVELKSYNLYSYCLSEHEMYDIFVAKYTPTYDTPRIVVQLRTQTLILKGVMESIRESFERIRAMLSHYGIDVVELNENRIDYAWHTNCIQDVNGLMDDEYLKRHLKSRARDGVKHFNPQTLDYNYLAIGNRSSNCIFARIYDKTREVIEEAYKGFFLDRWLENGLISRYDHYCLNIAYQRRSYTVGLLVGRIEWYLQYGKSDELKAKLAKLKETCDVKSSNSKEMRRVLDESGLADMSELAPGDIDSIDICRKALHNKLPIVTTVVNIEYQTKRAFCKSLDQMINGISVKADDPIYDRITAILACERSICDYLTSYHGYMSFVRDRSEHYTGEQIDKHPDEVYKDFWWRIRSTKIKQDGDYHLFRSYKRHSDIKRMESQLLGKIASYSMLLRADAKEDHTFAEDVSDVLCRLNDNDLYAKHERQLLAIKVSEAITNVDYPEIRRRKKRMMRNVVENPHDNPVDPVEGEENNET